MIKTYLIHINFKHDDFKEIKSKWKILHGDKQWDERIQNHEVLVIAEGTQVFSVQMTLEYMPGLYATPKNVTGPDDGRYHKSLTVLWENVGIIQKCQRLPRAILRLLVFLLFKLEVLRKTRQDNNWQGNIEDLVF